jgi:hypothetical protein
MRSSAKQSSSITVIARAVARRQALDTRQTFSCNPQRCGGSSARSTYAHSRYRRPGGLLTSSAACAVVACHASRRTLTPWSYPPDHWTTRPPSGLRHASSPVRAQAGRARGTSCRFTMQPRRDSGTRSPLNSYNSCPCYQLIAVRSARGVGPVGRPDHSSSEQVRSDHVQDRRRRPIGENACGPPHGSCPSPRPCVRRACGSTRI